MRTSGSLDVNQIHEMDCLEGMELMEPKSVSVTVTSPPYNLAKPYNHYDDRRPRDDYLNWMREVGRHVRRVLTDDGSFFLNVGGKPSDPWIPLDIAQVMREYFVLQNTIIWVKSVAIRKEDTGNYPNIRGDIAVGHYKPVNSDLYLNGCHEYIFHFTEHGDVKLDKLAVGVPYQDKVNIKRWKSTHSDLRDRGNVWFIPYRTIWKSRPHPTVFPSRLPEMCIRLHGVERTRLVLDPFMGIGSTALACVGLDIPYLGFEIDPTYIEVAEERLAQKTFSVDADKDEGHREPSRQGRPI